MPASERTPTERADAAGPEDGLEARLIGTIPPLMRHLLAHARRRPSWGEMTYQQYNVLRLIDAEGTMAHGEIARRLLVSAPVITRQATALSDAGLVDRQPDPDDRRSVRLALTRAGRRRVRAMRKELLAAADELLAPLAEERRAAIANALEQLRVLLPASTRPGESREAAGAAGLASATATAREPGQRRAAAS